MSDPITDPTINRVEHDNSIDSKKVSLWYIDSGTGLPVRVSSSSPLPVGASVIPISDSTPATQNITVQDTGSSTSTANANSQSIRTGTPTAGSVAVFPLSSWESVGIMTSGVWTGTLLIEGSIDGGLTYSQKAVKQVGTGYITNSLTGNFFGEVNTATLTHISVRSTTAWTGTATILVRQSVNDHSVYVANNLTLKDGTVQSITNTIKPASTTPLATDTALVVTQSPNSPGDKITDGTNSANVVANDSGYNGVPINNATKTIPFTTSSAGVQTLLANTDVRGYSWIEVVYTSVGVGLALTAPFSSTTGGTYVSTLTWGDSNNAITASAIGTTVNRVYFSAVKGNYFQLAVSALTSGTLSGTVTLRSIAPPLAVIGAIQSGAYTVGSNSATGVTFPANAFAIGASNGTNLTALTTVTAAADGSNIPGGLVTSNWAYNNTTFDRTRNNTTASVIAAGTTSTQTGISITNYNAKKLVLVINISSGAGTLTVAINGTTASGYPYNILTSTALTGIAANELRVFPGATPTTNLVANDVVPRNLLITATVVGSVTYGIDYILAL